ncbi:MAG: deoxyribose-phosphate aldolase [Zetaproteobacteria bacterium]|nr:deoxyribose-phosphate aldolase [Pseudobdellovibrionaceae bacterium]
MKTKGDDHMESHSKAERLAMKIDHTALRPNTTETDVIRVCSEARAYGFKAVCIESKWLNLATMHLEGTRVLPITVISFPHGQDILETKVADIEKAIGLGAKEIDIVMNRRYLQDKDYRQLYRELSAVVHASGKYPLKVILETSELTDHEKVIACSIAQAAGVTFIKTSTGFSKYGATVDDVKLMRQTVGDKMKIKASGGIRSLLDAEVLMAAGADRFGCSTSIDIMDELHERGSSQL